MSKQKGFSLIELLIVVAIILIIAAIAIPNLLRARMAANESSAVASIRTINTAEITYNSTYPTVGFSGTLLALGGAIGAACVPAQATACLIDAVLANNGIPAGSGKSGYLFATGAGTKAGVSTSATPSRQCQSRLTRLVFVPSVLKKMQWFALTRRRLLYHRSGCPDVQPAQPVSISLV